MTTNLLFKRDVLNLVDAIADGMIASLDVCTMTDTALDMYRAAVLDYAHALHKALGFDES